MKDHSCGSVRRREFLKASGAAALGLMGIGRHRGLAAESEVAPFSFVHMTDIHVQPELDAEQGLRQCLAAVNRLKPRPDFVITGGDLVMDSLAVGRDRLNLQWEIFDRSLKDLELPVHHTIGNHDVVGWSSKAIIKPDEHKYGKKIFADRYGEGQTFRSFDHKGWHFVLLDSIGQAKESPDYIGLMDEPQLDWLKSDLEKIGKMTPIAVVTHIPFYSTWDQVIGGSQRPVPAQGLVTNAHIVRKILQPVQRQARPVRSRPC